MSPECFRRAVEAVQDFPLNSPSCQLGRRKIVGIMGGEPLLHPKFPELVQIVCERIPDRRHRGLWTGEDWRRGAHPIWGQYRPVVEKLVGPNPNNVIRMDFTGDCGYLNWNMHLPEATIHHHPMLVAISDLVKNERRKWELIQNCWVQRQWSPSMTPKGAFFCEVAAAFDIVFHGPGGMPLKPGWWQGDIEFAPDETKIPRVRGPFKDQIERWCPQCGACLPLPGRPDWQNIDDVSQRNLRHLTAVGSPRIENGDYVEHNLAQHPYNETTQRIDWQPDTV